MGNRMRAALASLLTAGLLTACGPGAVSSTGQDQRPGGLSDTTNPYDQQTAVPTDGSAPQNQPDVNQQQLNQEQRNLQNQQTYFNGRMSDLQNQYDDQGNDNGGAGYGGNDGGMNYGGMDGGMG
jgi:hypothetical protein